MDKSVSLHHRAPARNFYSLFPVPDFLALAPAAIDISDSSIKALSMKIEDGIAEIHDFNTFDIPEKTIEGGVVSNEEHLAEVLRTAQKEQNFSFAHVSLPEEKMYLFTMAAEGTGTDELYKAIEIHLEENVPLPSAETIFDFNTIERFTYKRKKYTRVAVSAMSREMVDTYVRVLSKASVSATALSGKAEALAAAVIPHGDEDTRLILDIGAKRTGVTVVSGGVPELTTTVEIGGDHITRSLENALKVGANEAEKIKREKGLDRHDNRIREAVGSVIASLKDEVSESIRYWSGQMNMRGMRARPISSVVLVGGSALVPGLREFLSDGLELPVALGNVWSNVSFMPGVVPELTFEESLRFASAVGLVIANTE